MGDEVDDIAASTMPALNDVRSTDSYPGEIVLRPENTG